MQPPPLPRRRAFRAARCALALLAWPCLVWAQPAADEARSEEDPTPSGPPPGVEVIRVRGRGLGSIVPDVPASVTAFDARTIEALGAQDVSDLARVTPNLNVVQPGETQANFFVRGIGLFDPSANAAGSVTIFQDDVALNAPAIQLGQLYDIESVEVVRGPQGAGPYRNASAGAIRVISNLPTGNPGGRLRASLGRYAAGGGKGAMRALIQDYEGYLEPPLAGEALSSRFAFRLRKSDPFMTNGCGNAPPLVPDETGENGRIPRPQGATEEQLDAADVCGERGTDVLPPRDISRIPTGLPKEVDFEDNWAARGFLRLQPPESELDLLLNLHGSRMDQDQRYGQAIGTSTGGARGRFFGAPTVTGYHEPDQRAEVDARCESADCSPAPVTNDSAPPVAAFERALAQGRPLDRRPFRGDYNREGVTERDTWGAYLRGELALGDSELFVLASVDAYERFRDHDTDFTPDILFEVAEDDEAWQTYQELRLAGELPARPLAWELGGYFLEEAQESTSRTELRALRPMRRNAIERAFSQDTRSFGVWGSFTWDFLDDLTLEGGARLNWERKDFTLFRQQFLVGIAFPRESSEQTETWAEPTGNLVLTYHFDEEVSAFVKYGRGFKAGHFNALASEDIDRPPAEREINDAWEAGLRGRWLDGRLSASATGFYYRYQDFQVFLFRDVAGSPPVLEIVNAERAENYGIELEGRLEPLRGRVPRALEDLELTANFSWLHGEYLDFQLVNTFPFGLDIIPVEVDFSGRQLQNSPDFKVSGSATWTFDLGRWGFLVPRYDFSWTDDVFFGVNEGRGSVDEKGNPLLPELAVGQPALWLHDLRLAYRTPTANVEVAAWVRNLTDETYKTFAFDASRFSAVVLNFVGDPRTIGVDLTVTF